MSKIVKLNLPVDMAKFIRDTFYHGHALYGKAGKDIIDIIDNAAITDGEPSRPAKVVQMLPEEGI